MQHKVETIQKIKYLKQSQNKQVLTPKKIRMFKNWEPTLFRSDNIYCFKLKYFLLKRDEESKKLLKKQRLKF